MEKNFFGSKLNSILLLILIVLMIFALRIMLKNKETYLPSLVSNEGSEEYFSGIVTDRVDDCIGDGGWCMIEVDDENWVLYSPGISINQGPMGNVKGPFNVGEKVDVYAIKSSEKYKDYPNLYTIFGKKKYYVVDSGPTSKWVKWTDTIVETPVEKFAPTKDSGSYFLKYVGSPQLAMGLDGGKRCIGDQDFTICAIGTDVEVIKYYEDSKNQELYVGRWTKAVEFADKQRIRFYAPDFSFDYSVNAVLEIDPEGGSFGVPTYSVFRPQGVLELVMLIPTNKLGIEDLQGCPQYLKSRVVVLNGKTMTACDSTGDPTTTYVYTKGDKTLIAHTEAGGNSTIDPASFEIK